MNKKQLDVVKARALKLFDLGKNKFKTCGYSPLVEKRRAVAFAFSTSPEIKKLFIVFEIFFQEKP